LIVLSALFNLLFEEAQLAVAASHLSEVLFEVFLPHVWVHEVWRRVRHPHTVTLHPNLGITARSS
jgi:hypothetical protein